MKNKEKYLAMQDCERGRRMKKWGIKVKKKWWILDNKRNPAIYWKKAEAVKEAEDFNRLRIDKEKIYTVEEFK